MAAIARLDLPPEAGSHSVYPLLGVPLPEFDKQRPQVSAAAAGMEHGEADTSHRTQALKDFGAFVSLWRTS